MGVETYTVQYICDPSNFLGGVRQMESAVRSLDSTVVTSKKNLSGFAGGGGRSAANAAKKIQDLQNALNGVAPAANSAKSSLTGLGGAANKATAATSGLTSSTITAIAQATAIAAAWTAATAAINIYSKASEDAKRHMNEGAQSGLDKRNKAREYATLLHKNEVDDEVMKDIFATGQAGGSVFDKALVYSSQFEGSVPAGELKGHITADQKKSLKGEGLAFGNRIGLDEKAAGDLVGVIPQYVDLTKDEKGKKLSTEDGVDKALGQLNALTAGLMDGRGEITTLARSEVGAAAGMLASGHATDHAEVGALAGVASTFSKTASGSGTAVKQMDRLVNEGVGEEGEFMKGIGVADQRGTINRLGKLKEHLDAQRKAAPDPARFDPKAYLQSKGFQNDTELDSTLAFVDNFDVLRQRETKARALAGDGKSVRAGNQQYRSSLVGQDRIGQAMQEAGNYEQTRKRQRLAAARKAAYGQLQAEGKIDTFGANLTDGFMDGTINRIRPNTEHEARIDQRVWEDFRAAAKQAGIQKDVDAADPRYLSQTGPDGYRHAPKIDSHGHKGLDRYEAPYAGQDPTKLDDALNQFGPLIEKKSVSIAGPAVGVGVNPATVPAQQQAAPAGQAGNAAPAGAANLVAPHASVDASGLQDAGKLLLSVADKWGKALEKMRYVPRFGGDVDPYRA